MKLKQNNLSNKWNLPSSSDEKFYIDYFKGQVVYEIACCIYFLLVLHNKLRNNVANKVETVIRKKVESFMESHTNGATIFKEIT